MQWRSQQASGSWVSFIQKNAILFQLCSSKIRNTNDLTFGSLQIEEIFDNPVVCRRDRHRLSLNHPNNRQRIQIWKMLKVCRCWGRNTAVRGDHHVDILPPNRSKTSRNTNSKCHYMLSSHIETTRGNIVGPTLISHRVWGCWTRLKN